MTAIYGQPYTIPVPWAAPLEATSCTLQHDGAAAVAPTLPLTSISGVVAVSLTAEEMASSYIYGILHAEGYFDQPFLIEPEEVTATPDDVMNAQLAIIEALPAAPDNAGIASILQRVQQLQGITITLPSLPVPVEIGKLPKVQANTWCELSIIITNLAHQEGDQYRYVLRYAAYGRDPVINQESIPVPMDEGSYQFPLRFAAPAAPDSYQVGIERRRMVDGHPQDTPIATGTLVVTADIVRPRIG